MTVDPQSPLEPAAPMPPTVWQRMRAAPFTSAILAINVLLFGWAEMHGDTTTVDTLVRYGASARALIWSGEYWRFVTPMFLHIGWMHLAWNTYFLFRPCAQIEQIFRPPRFLALYLLSGIGATATSLLCHNALSAGASGAGFGMLGVILVLRRRQFDSWRAFTADPGVRSTMLSLAIWTVIGFTALHMDNFAHLGGLLFGSALAWVFTDARGIRASWNARGLALFGVALVATVVAAAIPRPWFGG